ncbi:MAG TPA: pyridoxal 5'-phosphate synthase glutaminase subunit PdxT [Methylomirabilota bacterium]|jgi:5'-phosphate synthase pdxT subunit|nr:pyridoxal 5'-phosphate synthase glutaminase subunit PdxT [Methylomirabilota bacterium]
MREPVRIGVLALQGDFAAHARALGRLGVEAPEVRNPGDLAGLDGLVIPGGESTTLLTLMGETFPPVLRAFHEAGRPIYGTCAGLILLAREVVSPPQPSLGLIDVTVERNAYGRQRESFETEGEARFAGAPAPLRMVFIRAPRIVRTGAGVTTLATHRAEPVLVQAGTVLAGTFHPELTDDLGVHRHFRDLCRAAASRLPQPTLA